MLLGSRCALLLIQLAGSTAASVAGRSYWLPPIEDQPLTVSELGWGVPPGVTENTLTAFLEGLALGASGVEVTSRRTADGRIAMLHDARVPGCHGGQRSCVVPLTNFSDLPNGTLELEQYLEAVAPHGMNIMMQNNWFEPGYDSANRVAEVVVDRVIAAGLQDRVLLSAFDLGTMRTAREHCGGCGIRTAWLAMSWKTERAMGIPSFLAPEMNSSQYLDKVQSVGLDAFNPEAIIVDRALFEQARARGIPIYVWWMGVNTTSTESPEEMQLFADCGVTGFITPRVAWGIDAMAHKSPKTGEECSVPPKGPNTVPTIRAAPPRFAGFRRRLEA